MRQLLTIREFCAQFSLGRTAAYRLLTEGRVEARKHGSRTLIDAASAQRWAESLPAYAPTVAKQAGGRTP